MGAGSGENAVWDGPVCDVAVCDDAVWDEAVWLPRRDAHTNRVDHWLAGHRERRSRGVKHPVEDFLFEYYNLRPYQLRRWHPGHGVALTGASAEEMLSWSHYRRVSSGVAVDAAGVVAAREASLRWTYELLANTAARPGQFGCFGLHEWAMVYRQPTDQLRHPDWPLRRSPDEVAQIVQERGVRCSHFDAFRFFTPAAQPLNLVQPTRASQQLLEQPGCLHANMDLYKHAYKLSPLAPSELVAETFALAREIRTLDMRASPYDFSALGLEPVTVETPEGRAEYARQQRRFSDRAAPLRQRLLAVLTRVLELAPRAGTTGSSG